MSVPRLVRIEIRPCSPLLAPDQYQWEAVNGADRCVAVSIPYSSKTAAARAAKRFFDRAAANGVVITYPKG